MPRGIFPRKPRYLRPIVQVIGPGIAYVSLTRGMFSVIESADSERVARHSWSPNFDKRHNRYTAAAKINGKVITLHRFLMGSELAAQVDHKNGCGLDNRRQGNLRPATPSQNQANAKRRSDNKTGYKGVTLRRRMFEAHITHMGKRRYLGSSKSGEGAHAIYCARAAEIRKEFARFR